MQYNATLGADTNYYNIAKDLAILNSKNEEITDRKGNLFGYWCKITTVSVANDSLTMLRIPNTWKVRNAFRKFHFTRDHMFREAGVNRKEMGTYGRTIRPYFSPDHRSDGDQPLRIFNIKNGGVAAATGGEWTYTSLASAPTFLESQTGTSGLPAVDAFQLTVLGDHVIDQTSTADDIYTWDSVGMVRAYNEDRMEMQADAVTDATAVTSPNNPLAAIRTQSVTSGEITEIAEDQELEAPPYDVVDTGDSIQAIFDYKVVSGSYDTTDGDGGQVTVFPPSMIRKWGLYFVPAGLLALSNLQNYSNALQIEVIGKELCKDAA